ncbi:aminopeptidase N [Desulfurivibrio sp. D14AmB]|uniref:aminopeptidase N n=1 Tax=Desulfurivibrio sp. D14AmB TaxID=3374370 RepID=UPI00376EC459
MEKNSGELRPVLLSEYRPPLFLVAGVELAIDLYDDHALVRARLELYRNPAREGGERPEPLILDGEELELLRINRDGQQLSAESYRLEGSRLVLPDPPARFTLETTARIHPERNTALEGLYRSGTLFCTQCEPEGFRRITWYPDRPDVLAPFTVTISADQQKCPVLLAGGNPGERGKLPAGRHYATFRDPYPKPSYLFAMVAGDLAGIHDCFTTASGRQVALAIYVEHHNRDKCDHAMAALKQAMRWDEETFGLEYDLDHYLIVAVDDFNMGAMENKGLNIFNAAYVLARPESATDDDFERIEAVIAHEYFHNWTGNRVTCRDWFQLSLKEGLTVFRDQLFSQSVHSPGGKRIGDVRLLRDHQFAEDAGPLAHPVRPESYLEINNFYTLTIYEKGAELVRMLHTLLGAERFRRGLKLYLERQDGTAATVEDFLAAMAAAGDRDLDQFKRWYFRPGTPRLQVRDFFEPARGRYRLRVVQNAPPEEALHIPLAVGLLDAAGRELTAALLEVTEVEQEFVFEGMAAKPTPSLLRGFSAPVRLDYPYSDQQLQLLLAHDSDPFTRWEAAQLLNGKLILERAGDQGEPAELPASHAATYRRLLTEAAELAAGKTSPHGTDKTLAALLLTLPSEDYLAEQMELIEVAALHRARQSVRRDLALALAAEWRRLHDAAAPLEPYRYGAEPVGNRRLKNLALDFLLATGEEDNFDLAHQQFRRADNMTDSLAALKGLVHAAAPQAPETLAEFARRWRDQPLVMDKWLAVQATAPYAATLEQVRRLLAHPAFRIDNPNRVRALIGSFAANPVAFHAADGSGYRFLADQILVLDPKNPQVAARLATRLSRWRRYAEPRRGLMRGELARLAAASQLSRDLREVVGKSL